MTKPSKKSKPKKQSKKQKKEKKNEPIGGTTNPVGRPTKYDPKFCDDFLDHSKLGGFVETYGAFLGDKYGKDMAIHKDTTYEWAKKHKEFADAIKIGWTYRYRFYEQMAKNGAIGNIRRIKKETVKADGTVEREYEYTGLNAATWIFIMKNCFKWTDRQEMNVQGEIPPIQIYMPDNKRDKK